MLTLLLANAGLLTGILEAVATSIGAGLLIGGFVVGLAGLATGTPVDVSERKAVTGGYFGGFGGLCLLAIDMLSKHVV